MSKELVGQEDFCVQPRFVVSGGEWRPSDNPQDTIYGVYTTETTTQRNTDEFGDPLKKISRNYFVLQDGRVALVEDERLSHEPPKAYPISEVLFHADHDPVRKIEASVEGDVLSYTPLVRQEVQPPTDGPQSGGVTTHHAGRFVAYSPWRRLFTGYIGYADEVFMSSPKKEPHQQEAAAVSRVKFRRNGDVVVVFGSDQVINNQRVGKFVPRRASDGDLMTMPVPKEDFLGISIVGTERTDIHFQETFLQNPPKGQRVAKFMEWWLSDARK